MKCLEGSTILLTTHDDCHLSGRHVAAIKKLADFIIIFFKKVKGDYCCFIILNRGIQTLLYSDIFFKKKFTGSGVIYLKIFCK